MRGCSTGLRAFDGVEVCVFIIVASYEQVLKKLCTLNENFSVVLLYI